MQVHIRRERPGSWAEWRSKLRHGWLMPFVLLEYGLDWVVYALSHWRFLELLEYLGSFGVLVAVIFYFSESGDRLKQKHYQAWQVINSAEGKGGNGGRIEALEELNADGVPLVGVNLSSAFLMGVRLPKGKLARANFDAADARDAEMAGANRPTLVIIHGFSNSFTDAIERACVRLHMRLVALTSKSYGEGVDESQFGPTLLILLSITTTG